MYALFRGDQQISKAHSTRVAVAVEAFERGLVVRSRWWVALADGCVIRAMKHV